MADSHLYRQKFIVLLADVLGFLAAFATAMHLRFNVTLGMFEEGYPPWGPMLNALPIMLAVWLVTARICGLYRIDRMSALEEGGRLLQALMIFLGILLSITFFYRGFSYSRGFVMLFVPLLVAFTLCFRVVFRLARHRLMALDGVRRRVLLVGDSAVSTHLARTALASDSPIRVVGVLDNDAEVGTELISGVNVLGTTDQVAEIAESASAHGIIIAGAKLSEPQQLELLDTCLAADLEWQVVPSVYELMLDRVRFTMVGGLPLLGLRRSNIRGVNRVLKRAFDIVASAILLVLASPLMIAVAIGIRLTSKGPIFYVQDRVAEGGRAFKFLKFRSMRVDTDDSIHREYAKKWISDGKDAVHDKEEGVYKITNDPRVTRIGAFIRKFSIDELPQLLNVFRGDMSVIGPRPSIPYEVEVYRQWHRRRLEGPQGITGLWQVSGRNRLSFDEMVKLDIDYIENWSLGRDLRILWRTVGVVLFDRAY